MIDAGIVLKQQVIITLEEKLTLSAPQLLAKYDHLMGAPNVDRMDVKATGATLFWSRVPVVTNLDLVKPRR